jgi:hypothetical protein
MHPACYGHIVKSRTTELQIRGIPVKTRDALRRKAESKGVSMSQYLIDLIRQDVERLAVEDWIEMMLARPRSAVTSAQVQQALREARDEEAARWDERLDQAEPRG